MSLGQAIFLAKRGFQRESPQPFLAAVISLSSKAECSYSLAGKFIPRSMLALRQIEPLIFT